MRCPVCHHNPRSIDLFGGGYWKRHQTELICKCCAYWLLLSFGIKVEGLRA